MEEKKKRLKIEFKKLFSQGINKNLLLFFCYSISLICLIFFPPRFLWLFIAALIIIFWKIFFGLSWFNFIFCFLSVFQISILVVFFHRWWLFLIAGTLIILLFKKIFSQSPKEIKKWRLICFYYLFFLWILLCLGSYSLLNLNFATSFLLFALGIIIYSLIYFLMEEKIFFLNGLIIILLNLESFWLINYLTLPLPFLSLLLFLNYWFILYFYFFPQTN